MKNKIEIPRTMTEVMQDIDYNVQLLDMIQYTDLDDCKEITKKAIITDITQLRAQLNSLEIAITENNSDLSQEISRPRRIKRVAE